MIDIKFICKHFYHRFNTYLSRNRQITAGSQDSRYGSAKQRFNTDLNSNSQVTAGTQDITEVTVLKD